MPAEPMENEPARHRRRGSARPSTRERVLRKTLALFNERGIARVTTAEIADAAGINEGNLYYYFQRKEQLAQALFEEFAAAMLSAAGEQLTDPADLDSYAAYQRGWFRLMWEFRFFYRDGAAVRAIAPDLRERLATLNASGQEAVRSVFRTMAVNRLLRASTEEIGVLVDNIWIVSACWMDFRLMQQHSETIGPADLAWGFRQVETLYRPYLTAEARAHGQASPAAAHS